jgi:hypothetical protein
MPIAGSVPAMSLPRRRAKNILVAEENRDGLPQAQSSRSQDTDRLDARGFVAEAQPDLFTTIRNTTTMAAQGYGTQGEPGRTGLHSHLTVLATLPVCRSIGIDLGAMSSQSREGTSRGMLASRPRASAAAATTRRPSCPARRPSVRDAGFGFASGAAPAVAPQVLQRPA